jgi:hypothetical protein
MVNCSLRTMLDVFAREFITTCTVLRRITVGDDDDAVEPIIILRDAILVDAAKFTFVNVAFCHKKGDESPPAIFARSQNLGVGYSSCRSS